MPLACALQIDLLRPRTGSLWFFGGFSGLSSPRWDKKLILPPKQYAILEDASSIPAKTPKIEKSKFTFEHAELRAKLLDYVLRSNKSNINQLLKCIHILWLNEDLVKFFSNHSKDFMIRKELAEILIIPCSFKGKMQAWPTFEQVLQWSFDSSHILVDPLLVLVSPWNSTVK